MVSKMSGTTRALTHGLFQNPQKVESIIGMVRTFAPLTSPQTVTKLNTYLPAVEKVSTLLGMQSFINKAQNYRPIQSFNAKTPTDKITALVKSGNIPVAKLMANPLLANNMDKIMKTMAMGMAKNGAFDDMLSSFSKGNKDGLNDLLSSLSSGDKKSGADLSSLMETFMPIINNIMSSSETSEENTSHSSHDNRVFKSAEFTQEEDEPSNDTHANVNALPAPEKSTKNEKHLQRQIRIRQRRK